MPGWAPFGFIVLDQPDYRAAIPLSCFIQSLLGPLGRKPEWQSRR